MTSIKWIVYITVAIVMVLGVVVFAATAAAIGTALVFLVFTVYVVARCIKRFCEEPFLRRRRS